MKHPFHSAMAIQFEAFVQSRKAERRWSNVYDDNLHFFDNYCAEHYPNQATLCEGMLEWCNERPTEHGMYILLKKYPTFQWKSIPVSNKNG